MKFVAEKSADVVCSTGYLICFNTCIGHMFLTLTRQAHQSNGQQGDVAAKLHIFS